MVALLLVLLSYSKRIKERDELEPIPKMADRHIAWESLSIDVPYRPIKHLPSIRKIPDELWDEIKLLLPPEKSNKTIVIEECTPR